MLGAVMSGFLQCVNEYLGSLGFTPSNDFDKDVYLLQWRRPVRWANGFFDFVAMSEQINMRERSEVGARLGIASQLLTDVENGADLWRCGTGMLDPRSLPWRFPAPVIFVALHWLSRNQGSNLKISWAIRDSRGATDEQDFIASFGQYGVPFFKSVEDIDDLAELVLRIEEYPRNLPAIGFMSPDAVNYLAIALFHSGQRERAFDLLDAAANGQYPPSVRKTISRDPNYRNVLACRVAKVRRFLSVMGDGNA